MKDFFRPKKYFRPHGLRESVEILSKFGEKAKIIAGGTDLLVQSPQGIECIIDISGLSLDYIKKEKDGFHIGAGTVINSLCNSPMFVSEPYRILSDAARNVATTTIRNMATIGGNLCNASPAADLSLPLMSLDAILVVIGPTGKREVPISNFFKDVNVTALEKDELLTEIHVPPSVENAVGCFIKLRHHQTAIDMAVVNVATLLVCKKGICEKVRIAMGSVAPTPIYASKAEGIMKGKELGEDIIQEAAEAAAEGLTPHGQRASATYRKRMVTVLVKRALEDGWRRSALWQM
jgi:carbon-monoxide dehydrogenase medium subunit